MYNPIDIEDEFHIILKMSILSGIKKEIYWTFLLRKT